MANSVYFANSDNSLEKEPGGLLRLSLSHDEGQVREPEEQKSDLLETRFDDS